MSGMVYNLRFLRCPGQKLLQSRAVRSSSVCAHEFSCWCPGQVAYLAMTSSMRNKSRRQRKPHRRTRTDWLAEPPGLTLPVYAGYGELC